MGRSAKFTKRLTKSEKDTLRVVANSAGTVTKEAAGARGYTHDTKATLKAAARALGARTGSSKASVKTTLGPSRAGHDVATEAAGTRAAVPDAIDSVRALISKHRASAASTMDIDLNTGKKPVPAKKKESVMAGMVDYVDLMFSNNPKKLIAKHQLKQK